MPKNPMFAPLMLSVVITILLTGSHIHGWWASALTTVGLLVAYIANNVVAVNQRERRLAAMKNHPSYPRTTTTKKENRNAGQH
jgi:hypothetical protein